MFLFIYLFIRFGHQTEENQWLHDRSSDSLYLAPFSPRLIWQFYEEKTLVSLWTKSQMGIMSYALGQYCAQFWAPSAKETSL